jgi:hypothetical protein
LNHQPSVWQWSRRTTFYKIDFLSCEILENLHIFAETDKRPADVNEGASSNGKQESGSYVPDTTNQGLPVVQTQSGENVPNTTSG